MATYTFPIAPTGVIPDESLRKPRAFYNFRDRKVTGFNHYLDSQGFYLGSLAWWILIIVMDSYLIYGFTKHTGMAGSGPSITGGENQWGLALSGTLVGLSVMGVIAQGVNVLYYNYARWPCTAISWFAQFFGFALSTAILGCYLYYPHSDVQQRNNKLGVAITDLAARTILISVQLGMAVEYFVRSVPDPLLRPEL